VSAYALAAEPAGEQIYRKQCLSCHGENGEGSKKYKKPLVGDKSVEQLTKLIAKTMPEDNPETLSATEAKNVAAYIHDAFYSVDARERNKPPRVELARLTVKQYRNAVSDLVAAFRPQATAGGKPGLQAEYHGSRNFRRDRKLIERIDSEVRFNFGTQGPDVRFDPYEYSIRWEGSVIAPETGEYEFIVRTDHALRLWVNNNRVAAIDAWVKSGSNTEFRAPIYLIAGRAYPIRLEFSKSQQGVNDPKRLKANPPAPAFIQLQWKLPDRADEVIPSRYLTTTKATEVYVPATAFPPDDRSMGWERGTTVSKAWDQSTTDAAIEAATYIVANIDDLSAARGVADRASKLRDFAKRFVERAFRRTITDEERRMYVDYQFEITKEPEQAIRRVVLLTLKSPRFLYRETSTDKSPFAVASRLSFALWDSLPDDELLNAAANSKLSTREEIAKQAERMLADPRAKTKLVDFLHTWLKVDQPRDLNKDPKRFPGFDPAVVSDLRTSLDLFLSEVVASESADFRLLLRADTVYLNGRLARHYGATLDKDQDATRIALAMLLPFGVVRPPNDLPFQKVKLDADQRAGVLTHPYLLAAFAYTGSTSPIHRGVFLARGVLGVGLKPPQEAFTPLAEDLHPTLTTRERVMLQTKPSNCQSCHAVINPLGFTLERFDAIGRYRTQDNGKPIDATGTYETRTGKIVKVSGARELAEFLASSEEVHAAFTQQFFHHLVQQPARAYGATTLADLREAFAKGGFDVRRLAVEVATTAALPAEKKRSKANR
jgi:cytochrome c553